MCGIAGVVKSRSVLCPASVLDGMRDEVSYRGPDDYASVFLDQGAEPAVVPPDSSRWSVGLGHRRLSILDLSAAGHQPMRYRSRCWIAYNGEVYNYLELRRELERAGHEFRSGTDTEVILAAYAEWGTSCFERMRGMWGLILFDAERREVVLCRDRLGIKPLYVWNGPGIVAVVSETKQLRHLPGFVFRADSEATAEYLGTGYEDPSRSFFRGVTPVPSGHWMRISIDSVTACPPQPYWMPERVHGVETDPREAGRAFAEKFRECVQIHLRSDVPVGCALSGGLDSTSIAVTANRLSTGGPSLQTFTCTFPGYENDEREYVDSVLAGIRHNAHFDTPDPARFMQDLDRFVWIHDEPVGSAAIYASYCLARLTRSAGVPVTLSGQGGDELFGGYWPSYFLYLRGLLRSGKLWALGSHILGSMLPSGNPRMLGQVPAVLRRYSARRNPAARGISKKTPDRAQRSTLLNGIINLDERSRRVFEIRTMFLPRLLKWDDRNSMAFSVEGRYPFLDHELIELVLSFRGDTLYCKGWTKWPLRLGLRDTLPAKVFKRRTKFGFETPQLKWICGPLRRAFETWTNCDRPAWDYVERNDVRRLASRIWSMPSPPEEMGQELFRLFVFDKWLERFEVAA